MNLHETYKTLLRRGMPKHQALRPASMVGNCWRLDGPSSTAFIDWDDPVAYDLITMHALRWALERLDSETARNAAYLEVFSDGSCAIERGCEVLGGSDRDILAAILAATAHLEPKGDDDAISLSIQWNPKDAEETWAQFERFGDHPSGAAFGEAEGIGIPRTICEAALDALEAEREHGAAADDARAMSGEYVMPPQVAALLRSGSTVVPKAPERNWDALIEAARRKPRTDDDVLREKFGGGAVS